ncbi:hypothetical protein, partial [Cryobacterium melibiosiphilum]
HETGWEVSQDQKGILHWTSPAGRHYPTFPEPRMSPPDLRPIKKTKKQIKAELKALEPRHLTPAELWTQPPLAKDEVIPF